MAHWRSCKDFLGGFTSTMAKTWNVSVTQVLKHLSGVGEVSRVFLKIKLSQTFSNLLSSFVPDAQMVSLLPRYSIRRQYHRHDVYIKKCNSTRYGK